MHLPCISPEQVQHGEEMRRVFAWCDRDRDGGTCPYTSRRSPADLPQTSRRPPADLPQISRRPAADLPRIPRISRMRLPCLPPGISAAELLAATRALGGASTLSLQEIYGRCRGGIGEV